MIPKQESLFAEHNRYQYGDKKHHQNLYISKLLSKKSKDQRLNDAKQDKAHKIMIKWADLETNRKLYTKNETNLEGEFLNQIFGEALGYTLFSENEETHNIIPKYALNGGFADAAIGIFQQNKKQPPTALIELKGPKTNLDRDRFNGRTAIQQCWEYLNLEPECPWGIVSNYVSFRLFNRNHSSRTYQLFVLQELRDKNKFLEFYYLFEKDGLLAPSSNIRPRAETLLEESGDRQQEVGNELYQAYDLNRKKLIQHLSGKPFNKTLNDAIHITQKILDRIIFVAFCEDRGLLPENSIRKAFEQIPPFTIVTNPKWNNFLDLFRSIDTGNKNSGIPPFNGGLFKQDDAVDNLELDDNWTYFFHNIGKYDFQDEVNVDVLGHIFERSISDIGKIKLGGLFEFEEEDKKTPKMKTSAERKKHGIYYTPPEFTNFITFNTIGKLIESRFQELAKKNKLNEKNIFSSEPDNKVLEYWETCYQILKDIKIVDPACGSGAFLISAYNLLEEKYQDVLDHIIFHSKQKEDNLLSDISTLILKNNLYGVDLSSEAVEITQLALWIRSAEKGETLADLSKNIVCGNSLIDDMEIHPKAVHWHKTFPEVLKKHKGFDCVIGNPPWERMKLQEREFFDATSPEIASAVNAASRREMIEKLKIINPDLHDKYQEAKELAEKNLKYVRKSNSYPLTSKGDINTYSVFAELAYNIVNPNGKVGLLVPSGIATDHTTQNFFGELVKSQRLSGLYDFENKEGIFADIHRSFKFSIIIFGGNKQKSDTMDFVFFARNMNDLNNKQKHIPLSSKDIELLNPNSKTCPIFRSKQDAELTKQIYKKIPILIDYNRKEGGNPWGVKFHTMFHQTNDAELFHTPEQLKKMKYKREGANWIKGKKIFLPLYEAKMIQMYDHRAAGVIVDKENWIRQGQTIATTLVQHQNPEFFVEPRWWADEKEILSKFDGISVTDLLAFKNVTSPTNRRTMIASMIPLVGVINSAPIILINKKIDIKLKSCLLSNLNSLVLDFVVRQKVGNVNLNFFIIEQLPILPPDFYRKKCPWDNKLTLEKWISERVLKLSCTSNDMIPLAKASGFNPPVHKWDTAERANLMAELDAAYFLFYGIKQKDVEYILSTFSGVNKEDGIFPESNTKELIIKYYKQFTKK